MKRFKLFITSIALLFTTGTTLVLAPAVVQAAPKSDVCGAIGSDADCGKTPANGIDLNSVVTTVVNLLSVIVGITAVIMIMISGFKYVTSGGDSSSVASAKNTLIYAIIGLVVVAFAQAIVKFVLQKATGTQKGSIMITHNYASVKNYYTLNY
jgi:hypothetical protein